MALENKLGITSSADLAREEERISKKKAVELFEKGLLNQLVAGNFSSLQFIHKHLFEDIYGFAGELRTVNIAKGNFRFAPVMYLEDLRKYLWTNYGVGATVKEFWDDTYKLVREFYKDVKPMPHVVEFLKEMKARGYLLGVATATARGPASVALESTGILPLLDARVSIEEVGVGKAQPDVYLECARRMGDLQKDEVIVFEDALYCVETLHAHGFTVVGVHEPSAPDDEWERLVPLCSRTIEDYRELL